MSIADVMADQWRLPRAPLAEVAARALNHRNADLIAQTIDALDVHAEHKVLDVGFGGGLSLRLLLHKTRGGQVCGVDPSVDMVKRAAQFLGNDLDSGRLALQVGEANALPYGPEEFDRVLTCQTVYFWSDVCGGLAELHRVLAPGGSCAVAMMPKPLQERFSFPSAATTPSATPSWGTGSSTRASTRSGDGGPALVVRHGSSSPTSPKRTTRPAA